MKKNLFQGNTYVILFYRLIVFLLFLSLSRFCLYFFNVGYFGELKAADLVSIYIQGLRFDVAALIMINAPLIFFRTLPFRFNKKESILKIILYITLLLNSLAIIFNLIDIVYFRFTLKRSTFDLFNFIDANVGLFDIFKTLISDFWYLIILAGLMIFLMIYTSLFYKERIVSAKQTISQTIYKSILFVVILGISILGMRGGIQLKPINLIDAGRMVNSNEVPLILNTPFSLLVTIGKQKLENKSWFNPEEAKMLYNPIHQYNREGIALQKKNVVVLILESFSANKIGYFNAQQKSLTPFLDSLLYQSLTYNGIANGKKSIEGIPAILSGIPSLMRQPFLTSSYSANQFTSLAGLLQKKGFTTAFFHGGKNGTMNFDSYAAKAGFESYFGMNEYANNSDYDGSWGIWDHKFYPFFKAKLDNLEEPFVAAFFSLSSHHPYGIPKQYQSKFSESDPLDNSITYSDFALSKFFESAKTEDWYANTLFVISADHTAELPNTADSSNLIHFEIPIAFFAPNDTVLLKTEHRKTIQQSDILPTVLDYLHYSEPFVTFGNSIFDLSAPDFSVYYLNEIYHIFGKDFILEYDGFKFTNRTLNSKEMMDSKKQYLIENQIKALIQNYADCMNHNQLIPTSQK
ncbi:MAG: sulfatase-like hydrolase/transferase [Bacteroidales bacterium]|nr:sulfatase-like hydrolase/transferase [Bacteroidales bacterium]